MKKFSRARGILAEEIADDPGFSRIVREIILNEGLMTKALLKKEEFNLTPYAMYAEYQDHCGLYHHTVFAKKIIGKGKVLQVKLALPEEEIISKLWQCVLTNPASLELSSLRKLWLMAYVAYFCPV